MKIQQIQPVSIWYEGESVEANKIGIDISYDNMISSAAFRYTLFGSENGTNRPLTTGYLSIDGDDYTNWGLTGDANQEAVDWVIEKLNLTTA